MSLDQANASASDTQPVVPQNTDKIDPQTLSQMAIPQFDAYPLPPGKSNEAVLGEKEQAEVLGGTLLKDNNYVQLQQQDAGFIKTINASVSDKATIDNYLLAANRSDRVTIAESKWQDYLQQQNMKPEQLTGDVKTNYDLMMQEKEEIAPAGGKTLLDQTRDDLIKASGGKITEEQLKEFEKNRFAEATEGEKTLADQKTEAPDAAATHSAEATHVVPPGGFVPPISVMPPTLIVPPTPITPPGGVVPPAVATDHHHVVHHHPHHPHPGQTETHSQTAQGSERAQTQHPRRKVTREERNDPYTEQLNQQELARITGAGTQQQAQRTEVQQQAVGQPIPLTPQSTDQWANNLDNWERQYLGRENTGLSDQQRYQQDYQAWQARYGQQQNARPEYAQMAVNQNNTYAGNYNPGYNNSNYYNPGYNQYGYNGGGLFGGMLPPIYVGFGYGYGFGFGHRPMWHRR